MPDRLLLVGMMGAGKTTVGELAAARLGWEFFDSDAQVLAATGRTVPEIFADDGEPAFRAEESRVLADAVAGSSPVVISVAGGAVLSEANRSLLAGSGVVVWLRADPETLGRRVGSGDGRPLIGEDPLESLRSLDRIRRPLYASIANLVIDVDQLAPEAVVDQVLAGAGLVERRLDMDNGAEA
ncbi:MAG TPA: shikimate kinase [Acidimicrobiales bacterium]|nr:shikimate kinase [Acidimicrobiales bacterium]